MDLFKKCFICKYTKDVFQMDCGHDLCPDCFRILICYNSRNLINSIHSLSSNLECFICDKTQNYVSKNDIENFLSKIVVPDDVLCSKHKLKVIKYCTNCNWGMCSNCNSIHNEIPINHEIIDYKYNYGNCNCDIKKFLIFIVKIVILLFVGIVTLLVIIVMRLKHLMKC